MATLDLDALSGWLAGLGTVGAAVGGFMRGRGQQKEITQRIHKVREDAHAAIASVSLATVKVSERVARVETRTEGFDDRLDRIEGKLDEALREMRR